MEETTLAQILAAVQGLNAKIDAVSAANTKLQEQIETLEEQRESRMAEGFQEIIDPSTPAVGDRQFARRATIETRASLDSPSDYFHIVDPGSRIIKG